VMRRFEGHGVQMLSVQASGDGHPLSPHSSGLVELSPYSNGPGQGDRRQPSRKHLDSLEVVGHWPFRAQEVESEGSCCVEAEVQTGDVCFEVQV
jgi:hypothetical protein